MNKAAKMLMMNRERPTEDHKSDMDGYGSEKAWHKPDTSAKSGYSMASEKPAMTRETADRWMKSLVNSDGTTGPHWTMEQTKQVQAQRGIDCDPLEFWVAANAVYSDYFGVAKEMDVNNIDFYAKMARAWLHDDDAMPDKAARYYDYIVTH